VWNMYGPTETTIWSTLESVSDSKQGIVAIGKPIANTQIAILDPHLRPVPIGVPGELFIGGNGLARGYRGRPDLTAERFIPNVFASATGARLYRTGDAARYRDDGTIEYLGRLDSQVKVRGFRIELSEIETVLATYPGINQTAVIVREDAPGEQRIVAYFTVDTAGETPTAGDLRAHLQKKLPAYMLPAIFMPLAALPLTPNGKIDRRALPPPEGMAREQRVYVAPATAEESALAAIWEKLLNVTPIGTTDNFFELGGDSILSMQAVARARQLGLILPIPDHRGTGNGGDACAHRDHGARADQWSGAANTDSTLVL
jgi:hypothetical protein